MLGNKICKMKPLPIFSRMIYLKILYCTISVCKRGLVRDRWVQCSLILFVLISLEIPFFRGLEREGVPFIYFQKERNLNYVSIRTRGLHSTSNGFENIPFYSFEPNCNKIDWWNLFAEAKPMMMRFRYPR